jgi:hypothetical protein
MMTIPDLLRDATGVPLDIESMDRVYLNGYVPTLQSSGGLVYFLEHHRGEITRAFAAEVEALAKRDQVLIVHFHKGQQGRRGGKLSPEVPWGGGGRFHRCGVGEDDGLQGA